MINTITVSSCHKADIIWRKRNLDAPEIELYDCNKSYDFFNICTKCKRTCSTIEIGRGEYFNGRRSSMAEQDKQTELERIINRKCEIRRELLELDRQQNELLYKKNKQQEEMVK